MNTLFDMGAHPGESVESGSRRRILNRVIVFGILPNPPLLAATWGEEPLVAAAVVVHLCWLGLLLLLHHRHVRTEIVAAMGVIEVLIYVSFLELYWVKGVGAGAVVALAMVIVAQVLLADMRRLGPAIVGLAAAVSVGLWTVFDLEAGGGMEARLMRWAVLGAFGIVVGVLLAADRRERQSVHETAVKQAAEVEQLLRMAELGQITEGLRHALSRPVQLALTRLQALTRRDPGAHDAGLAGALEAVEEIAAITRRTTFHEGDTNSACGLLACLNDVRLLTFARVRHAPLHLDTAELSPDTTARMDRFTGTRLMMVLLQSGLSHLRAMSEGRPRLRLSAQERDDEIEITLRTEAATKPGEELVGSFPKSFEPLRNLCDAHAWALRIEAHEDALRVSVTVPAA